MGEKVRNAYAGGYSDTIKRQVKCMTCKKMRMQSAYSKRQLDVLRNAIVVQGGRALTGPGLAKCRECVGGQTVELRCAMCDETKGLEEFAKNQRHDRDRARCLACVQNHTETEPVLEEQKLLAESEMSTAQDTITSADDGYAYSTAYGEDEEDDDDYSIGGGVWVEPECPQGNPPTKSKEHEYTGYDQHGMPHLLNTPAATPNSVHSGWTSWEIEASSAQANTLRAGKPSPSVQKKNSNFAKIPRMRVERSDLRTSRTPAPTRENLAYEKGDHVDIEDFL
ncbi:Stc1 domain-containing protein [Aspergillus pseudocaelatus]|uniref:Stc1 domain-containing protein n=1 Tax=Aspergillus pseudocaelatus TaxID=1825620 RepID=A0ABQ6WCL3_9EURO|nr:Stc1 domain-containing protein [Aspergillus pseudocaelatus]